MNFHFHSRDGLTNFFVPQQSNMSCFNVITVAWIVITMLLCYRLICWLKHIMVPLWGGGGHFMLLVCKDLTYCFLIFNSLKAVGQTLSVF